MKINIYDVWGQIYIFPYVKLTHTRKLNGDLELIIGWLNKQIAISI